MAGRERLGGPGVPGYPAAAAHRHGTPHGGHRRPPNADQYVHRVFGRQPWQQSRKSRCPLVGNSSLSSTLVRKSSKSLASIENTHRISKRYKPSSSSCGLHETGRPVVPGTWEDPRPIGIYLPSRASGRQSPTLRTMSDDSNSCGVGSLTTRNLVSRSTTDDIIMLSCTHVVMCVVRVRAISIIWCYFILLYLHIVITYVCNVRIVCVINIIMLMFVNTRPRTRLFTYCTCRSCDVLFGVVTAIRGWSAGCIGARVRRVPC